MLNRTFSDHFVLNIYVYSFFCFPRNIPGVVENGMYVLWPFEAIFSWKNQ